MKTIAHLPPADNRMIDLTRHLNLPHGSLSPLLPVSKSDRLATPDPWPARARLTPQERLAANDAAEEFTSKVLIAGLAFGLLMLAILAYHLATA